MIQSDDQADTTSYHHWMQLAIEQARIAEQSGEVPVGAVIVKDDRLIASASNSPIQSRDPSAHAEIEVMRIAGQALNNYRLNDCTLFVTLEPCPMCAGAIVHARIRKVVFGAYDPRTGAGGSVFELLNNERLNHRAEVIGGIMQEECSQLISDFFRSKRQA